MNDAMALLRGAGLPSGTAATFPPGEAVEGAAQASDEDRAQVVAGARLAAWNALDELHAWNVAHGDSIDSNREQLWQGWALTQKLQRALCALDTACWGGK